jgi:cell division septum initiation protein DivIVA
MTPEELDLIKKRLTIFLLMKSELRRDYERLTRASAGGDAEAEELANKILQATKPWST